MVLVDGEMAALYTRRPVGTIWRWASEGRISRHRVGRTTRYNLDELPHAHCDEDTGEWVLPDAPPLPQAQTCAA